MYFYVVKDFGELGFRFLHLIDGKPAFRNEPPRSYLYDDARKLADLYDCIVFEVGHQRFYLSAKIAERGEKRREAEE